MKRFLRAVTNPAYEWLRVALVGPVLLFPSSFPVVTTGALSALLLLWLIQVAEWRTPARRTPLRYPLALLFVMVHVAVWISPLPAVSLPKWGSVVLGMLVFRATLLSVTGAPALWRGVAMYLLLGLATVTVGVVGVSWRIGDDVSQLARITSHIPQLVSGLPGTWRDEGVNPNALGGTTLFFLPLLAVFVGATLREARSGTWFTGDREGSNPLGPPFSDRLLRTVALLASLYFVGVLVLSQSRSAWLAAGVTASVLMLVRLFSERRRRSRRVLLLVGVGTIIAVATLGARLPVAGMALQGRSELWSGALEAIHAHPFAGVGLNTFRRLVSVSPLVFSDNPSDNTHAHNIFLQTAVDVGIPGLVAYLAILIVASAMCWEIYTRGTAIEARLALGLWASLLAVHLFGLTDSIALGAKVGLYFWFGLGLIAGAHHDVVRRQTA